MKIPLCIISAVVPSLESIDNPIGVELSCVGLGMSRSYGEVPNAWDVDPSA